MTLQNILKLKIIVINTCLAKIYQNTKQLSFTVEYIEKKIRVER